MYHLSDFLFCFLVYRFSVSNMSTDIRGHEALHYHHSRKVLQRCVFKTEVMVSALAVTIKQ